MGSFSCEIKMLIFTSSLGVSRFRGMGGEVGAAVTKTWGLATSEELLVCLLLGQDISEGLQARLDGWKS